jgi:sarcosine oxidase subunit alpha
MSGGWNPAVHLASHHGGKPVWNDTIAAFVPGAMPPGLRAAGAASGHMRLADALRTSAASNLTTGEESDAITPLWQVPDSTGKSFVDFQNDVTASDVALAAREGFTAVEHLKRYTTLGMATDQGKTSNVTGLAIMASLTNRTIAETGTTVFRPPYTPVALGAMAGPHRGRHFRPTRRTPAHAWAERQGAKFVEAGEWLRATHFPQPNETAVQQSIDREVRTVRQSAGFCDVTTLGKIDVQGPDAAAFLDFIYANAISTINPGRVRYALMLRDDGFAFDDGTVARLSPTHFLLTTTTANAARVLRHMAFCHQILRPEWDVCIEPVTDQWAQFALAGPGSRTILEKLVDAKTDVSNAGLPFMATVPAHVAGVPGRLFRISFSGEMAYELAVPSSEGGALAEALLQAGATPYGLEALNVLRLEKGHPVGAELNGQTTAADLGLGGMLSRKKDFIGRVLSQRPALLAPDRQTLVGLRPCAPGATLQAGSHLIPDGAPATAENDRGHVTSAAYSATLGHWIALGLLANGADATGRIFRAVNPLQGTETEVEVVSRVFHDPEGRALHG